jgi:hypothetical protein
MKNTTFRQKTFRFNELLCTMKKNIFICTNSGKLTLIAECVYESNQIQKFHVSGKTRSIVLQTNYPLLRSQNSKKEMIGN